MTKTLKTVSAYQSLLKEDDYDLKEAGLKTLLANVNQHWGDIANDITDMYYSSHSERSSSETLSSPISHSLPSSSQSSTLTSTITSRRFTMPCSREHTSTLRIAATSPRCWLTNALSTLSREPKSSSRRDPRLMRIPCSRSTRRWWIKW